MQDERQAGAASEVQFRGVERERDLEMGGGERKECPVNQGRCVPLKDATRCHAVGSRLRGSKT